MLKFETSLVYRISKAKVQITEVNSEPRDWRRVRWNLSQIREWRFWEIALNTVAIFSWPLSPAGAACGWVGLT